MFVLRSIRKSKKIIGGTIKNGHSRDAGNNAQKKDKKKQTKNTPHTTRKASNTYLTKLRG